MHTEQDLCFFQGQSVRKDIERAAKKGQSLTVSKKKQELEEYKVEIAREGEAISENEMKLEKMLERLSAVDEKLHSFGVSIPEVDTLRKFVILVSAFSLFHKANLFHYKHILFYTINDLC